VISLDSRYTIRPIAPSDAAAFSHFAALVSAGEGRFLKNDLEDGQEAFARLLDDRKAYRQVAVDQGARILGLSGAFPGTGWSAHVAELRVLVSEEARRQGIGRALARAALVKALQAGCSHVYVEVVAEQEALASMFQDIGFEPEALLSDFVCDSTGSFHDLMLLTHRADDQGGRTLVLGLNEELG
jgi:ribosomal protein S18 acetylase RimI-like enzyme